MNLQALKSTGLAASSSRKQCLSLAGVQHQLAEEVNKDPGTWEGGTRAPGMSTSSSLEAANVSLYSPKGFCRCDKVQELKMGRVVRIAHMGLMQSQGSIRGGKDVRGRGGGTMDRDWSNVATRHGL